ncbi:MAG: hypothetical protein NC388_05820 [Clostridium sp.]|nr:hypothetical protein [Clostridium sp.]
MKKRIYISPAVVTVELENEEMLCTSGNLDGNLDNQGETDMDGEQTSVSFGSSNVWDEW